MRLMILILFFIAFYCNASQNFQELIATVGINKFVIPNGVFNLDINAAGGSSVDYKGYAAHVQINVIPGELLYITIGGISTECDGGYQATKIVRASNDDTLLLLAGAGRKVNGAGFFAPVAGSGEGRNGKCERQSYYDSGVVIDFDNAPSDYDNAFVELNWNEQCDSHDAGLTNTFTVDLLPTSSLYVLDSVPILDINFVLPNAFINIHIDYSDILCDFSSSPVQHTQQALGCNNQHQIRISNYGDVCPGLTYEQHPTNSDSYALSGSIMVYGDIEVDTSDLFFSTTVTRTAAEPISFRFLIPRTINVNSESVVIANAGCSDHSVCNDGCCIEGLCVCDGTLCGKPESNGASGHFCEIDNEGPFPYDSTDPDADPYNNTLSNDYFFPVVSPRGGCKKGSDIMGFKPTFYDNSGGFNQLYMIYKGETINLLNQSPTLAEDCHKPAKKIHPEGAFKEEKTKRVQVNEIPWSKEKRDLVGDNIKDNNGFSGDLSRIDVDLISDENLVNFATGGKFRGNSDLIEKTKRNMEERIEKTKKKAKEEKEEREERERRKLDEYLNSKSFLSSSDYFDYEQYVDNYKSILRSYEDEGEPNGYTKAEWGRKHYESEGVRNPNRFQMPMIEIHERVPDYYEYVKSNSIANAAFNSRTDRSQTIEEFGYEHYNSYGVPNNEELPTKLEYTVEVEDNGVQFNNNPFEADSGSRASENNFLRSNLKVQCQDNLDLELIHGETDSIIVQYETPIVNGNPQGDLDITFNPEDGSRLGEGEYFVTVSVTDEAGNRGSCVFTVNIHYQQSPPELICPTDISHSLNKPTKKLVKLDIEYLMEETDLISVSHYLPIETLKSNFEPSNLIFREGESLLTITVTDRYDLQSQCVIMVKVCDYNTGLNCGVNQVDPSNLLYGVKNTEDAPEAPRVVADFDDINTDVEYRNLKNYEAEDEYIKEGNYNDDSIYTRIDLPAGLEGNIGVGGVSEAKITVSGVTIDTYNLGDFAISYPRVVTTYPVTGPDGDDALLVTVYDDRRIERTDDPNYSRNVVTFFCVFQVGIIGINDIRSRVNLCGKFPGNFHAPPFYESGNYDVVDIYDNGANNKKAGLYLKDLYVDVQEPKPLLVCPDLEYFTTLVDGEVRILLKLSSEWYKRLTYRYTLFNVDTPADTSDVVDSIVTLGIGEWRLYGYGIDEDNVEGSCDFNIKVSKDISIKEDEIFVPYGCYSGNEGSDAVPVSPVSDGTKGFAECRNICKETGSVAFGLLCSQVGQMHCKCMDANIMAWYNFQPQNVAVGCSADTKTSLYGSCDANSYLEIMPNYYYHIGYNNEQYIYAIETATLEKEWIQHGCSPFPLTNEIEFELSYQTSITDNSEVLYNCNQQCILEGYQYFTLSCPKDDGRSLTCGCLSERVVEVKYGLKPTEKDCSNSMKECTGPNSIDSNGRVFSIGGFDTGAIYHVDNSKVNTGAVSHSYIQLDCVELQYAGKHYDIYSSDEDQWNVGIATDGIHNLDICSDFCVKKGFQYFGLECPTADGTVCNCVSYNGRYQAPSERRTVCKDRSNDSCMGQRTFVNYDNVEYSYGAAANMALYKVTRQFTQTTDIGQASACDNNVCGDDECMNTDTSYVCISRGTGSRRLLSTDTDSKLEIGGHEMKIINDIERNDGESKFEAWQRRILEDTSDLPEDEYGQYDYYFYAEDGNGNSATLNIGMEMIEAGEPFVDCAGCQEPYMTPTAEISMPVYICGGTNNSDVLNAYIPKVVNHSELVILMSSEYQEGKWLDHFPGQMVNLTTDEGNGHLFSTDYNNDTWVYLDCNCEIDREILIPDREWGRRHDMSQWTAILPPQSWDLYDTGLITTTDQVISPPPENNSFAFIGFYSTDAADLTGGCWMEVLYDVEAPNCISWYGEYTIKSENDYRTDPVNFTLPEDQNLYHLSNQSAISVATLSNGYINNDTYTMNLTLASVVLDAQYYIEDSAGNTATCDWRLTIINPYVCVYGNCENDQPPNITCPDSISGECSTENMGECGCIGWNDPEANDDYGVVGFNSTHISGEHIPVGITNVTYTVWDALNQTAQCTFSISLTDNVPPTIVNCPTDIQLLNSGNLDYATFTYMINATDDCPANLEMYIDDGEGNIGQFNEDGSYTIVKDFPIGTNNVIYTITDEAGNGRQCTIDIEVEDVSQPVITCPDNLFVKLTPSEANRTIFYEEPAYTDNSGSVSFAYIPDTGSVFDNGTYTINVVGFDSYGNTDYCSFEIEVDEAYNPIDLTAALTKVHVQNFGSNEVPQFGATLNMLTINTKYHTISNIDSESSDIVSNPVVESAICGVDDLDCQQTWTVDVLFDSCEIIDKQYQFTAYTTCSPAACLYPDGIFDVTLSISAANYCWQDLASIDIDAKFKIFDAVTFTAYQDALLANGESHYNTTIEDYTATSVIKHDKPVKGVIEVLSNSINIAGVNLISLNRAYYSDSDYTSLVLTQDISTSASIDNSLYHTSFSDDEIKNIDLETSYYARYTAVIELSYDAADGSSRRRLLEINVDERDERIATADVLVANRAENVELIQGNGVILLQLNNCEQSTFHVIEKSFVQPIANALRISSEYISLRLLDECYLQVIISSNCQNENFIVNDIIDELCSTIIKDPIHILHESIYNMQSAVYRDDKKIISFNTNVCYTEQEAAKYVGAEINNQLQSSSTNDVNTTSFDIKPYVLGLLVGIFIPVLITYYKKQSETEKYQPQVNVRRNSLVQIRRASITKN